MERSDFHRLMERYVKGEVTEQEKRKIETWLNVLKSEHISDAELTRQEEDTLFRQITSNLESVDKVVSFRPSSHKKKNRTNWVLGIAAGVVLVTVFFVALLVNRDHSSTLEVVASGDTEKIILNDGSIVWLKKGSKLNYYEKPSESLRYGELQGEALFEIAKDPTHPFVLQCGETSIRVVGTSFKLRSAQNEVALWVLTGHVKVSSLSSPDVIDLVANEKILITPSASHTATPLQAGEKESITANTEYDMQFDDIPLNEVLNRLGRKFNVRVKIEDNGTKGCRITADFTDHSLESTLVMISEITDLKYKVIEDQVIIEGGGCKAP